MKCPNCGTQSKKLLRQVGHKLACAKCGYINDQAFINTKDLDRRVR